MFLEKIDNVFYFCWCGYIQAISSFHLSRGDILPLLSAKDAGFEILVFDNLDPDDKKNKINKPTHFSLYLKKVFQQSQYPLREI